jgi:hypothetical protein
MGIECSLELNAAMPLGASKYISCMHLTDRQRQPLPELLFSQTNKPNTVELKV